MEHKAVIITDRRSVQAQEAEAYLKTLGYQVICVPDSLSLCDEQALSAFAEPYKDDLCGVIHPAPPRILGGIEQVTEEDWIRAREEGPIAALVVARVFCGMFREKGQGSLIFLNSIHAEKPVGRGFLYSTGCGAVQMLARELTVDYGADNVNIFFVQQGIAEEDLSSRSDVTPLYCGVDMRYPLRKMPEKGSLNGLLAFLLTPAAQPLTGSDLRADGGLTLFYNIHRHPVEGRDYGGRGRKASGAGDGKR